MAGQLPAEARLVSGACLDGWTIDTELAAQTIELVDAARVQWSYSMIDKKQHHKISEPRRIPRPPRLDMHAATKAAVKPSHDDLVAFARR